LGSMILGVAVHAAGGFGRVDNVRRDVRSNVLWVMCFWGVHAGSAGEEAEPKAFKFGAFTDDRTKYGSISGESKVTSCSHGQPCCCGDL
jgi:hypothetical protein